MPGVLEKLIFLAEGGRLPDDCGEELCGVHVYDVEGAGDAELPSQHHHGEDHTFLFNYLITITHSCLQVEHSTV
jgi:hypothetical protein